MRRKSAALEHKPVSQLGMVQHTGARVAANSFQHIVMALAVPAVVVVAQGP